MPLQARIILLVTVLLLFVTIVLSSLHARALSDALVSRVGEYALSMAQVVAGMPEIVAGFDHPDPASVIQPQAERVRLVTGAEFVVVGNQDGLRYSHPVAERLGQPMVGGDNAGALEEGRSYVSRAVGTLGPSLRGKTPVFNDAGEIIGVVSVGFLIDDIEAMVAEQQRRLWAFTLLALSVGVGGATLLARSVKRQILGLEPAAIAGLVQEREAVLESIREGILAIDSQGVVTVANREAKRLLGRTDAVGLPVQSILPNTRLLDVLQKGEPEYDRETLVGGRVVLVNRVPIHHNGAVLGVVASFRDLTEIERLRSELSQVRQYTDALRAQAHEFQNTLQTISGLCQLEAYDEVTEFVQEVAGGHQSLLQFLRERIPDVTMAGLLLGKYQRARERRTILSLDTATSLKDLPARLDRQAMVMILGNLIDNACEAAGPGGQVRIGLSDAGDAVVFRIEDSGPGVPPAERERIFSEGYSTKQHNRGLGLALVRSALDQLGGSIDLGVSDLGGAAFTVTLPKDEPPAITGRPAAS